MVVEKFYDADTTTIVILFVFIFILKNNYKKNCTEILNKIVVQPERETNYRWLRRDKQILD